MTTLNFRFATIIINRLAINVGLNIDFFTQKTGQVRVGHAHRGFRTNFKNVQHIKVSKFKFALILYETNNKNKSVISFFISSKIITL